MKKNRIFLVGLACMVQALTVFGQKDYKLSIGVGASYSAAIRYTFTINPNFNQLEKIKYGQGQKASAYFMARVDFKREHLDVTFGVEDDNNYFNSVNGHLYVISNDPLVVGFIHGNLHQPRVAHENWLLNIRYNRFLLGTPQYGLFGIVGLNYRTYNDAGGQTSSQTINGVTIWSLETRAINEYFFFALDLGIKHRFQTRGGIQFEAAIIYNRPFTFQYEASYYLNTAYRGDIYGTYKVRGTNWTFGFNMLVPINSYNHKRLNKEWYNWQ